MGGVIARHLAGSRPAVRPSLAVVDPSPDILKLLKAEGIEGEPSLQVLMKKGKSPELVIL